MSRTHHARPRRRRTDPTISAKKPGEARRWARRNIERGLPLRDRRKLDMPIKIRHAHADYCANPLDDKHTRCPGELDAEALAKVRAEIEFNETVIAEFDQDLAAMTHVGADAEVRRIKRHRDHLVKKRLVLWPIAGCTIELDDTGKFRRVYKVPGRS